MTGGKDRFLYFCLMHRLNKIFDYYVKASIHVAFSVLAFLYLTCQLLNIPIRWNLFFCIFFSTIPAYNLIKNTGRKKNRLYGLLSMDRFTLLLSSVSLAMAGYFGMYLAWPTLAGMLCLGAIAGIYALPVLPRGRNLRHSGVVKILLIGLVWAGTTVLLPVLEVGQAISGDVWIEFSQRILITLVLMVPFEIRDLGTDPDEMLTIPQRFGTGKTKRIGLWLCFACFLITYLKDDLSEMEILAKGGIVLSLTILLLFLPQRQGRYFASFWVEAFPVFWAVILWGSTELF